MSTQLALKHIPEQKHNKKGVRGQRPLVAKIQVYQSDGVLSRIVFKLLWTQQKARESCEHVV